MQAQEITKQVFRAAASVGANIPEIQGRHVGPEYIHFLTIPQGSANGVEHWLNTALDCGTGNLENIKRILALNIETRKKLATTNSSLRSQSSRSVHETPAAYPPIPYYDEGNEPGQDLP